MKLIMMIDLFNLTKTVRNKIMYNFINLFTFTEAVSGLICIVAQLFGQKEAGSIQVHLTAITWYPLESSIPCLLLPKFYWFE